MTLPFSQPSWFSSEDFASMTLNNAPGSLLEVIRGCAVTGYNPHPVTSIVVNAGVAVASCAAHGYTATYGKLLLIAGASEPLLNGRKQPTAVLTNSFTFPAPGVADGTYTGSMSARRAPLGWVEAHTGTNVAIFARSAPEATSMLLRVDDTAVAPASTTSARVLMLESASGVNVFSGSAPSEAQLADGQHWTKGVSNATPKRWHIVGDGRFLFYFPEGFSVGSSNSAAAFGDLVSARSPDAYGCVISGNVTSTATSFSTGGLFYLTSADPPSLAALAIARASSQLAGAVLGGARGGFANGVPGSSSYPTAGNAGNDIFIERDIRVFEKDTVNRNPIRGLVPGLAVPSAEKPYAAGSVVFPLGVESRAYLAIELSGNLSGMCLVDLTGPWY